MPRRKDLNHVAQLLLCRFMCRSNDLDGYWAIGRLYNIALSSRCIKLNFDIIKSCSEPQHPSLEYLAKLYTSNLWNIIGEKHIPVNYLQSAKIKVEFNVDVDRMAIWDKHPVGDPCIATISISTDHGKIFTQARGTRCLPKNEIGKTEYA